jgi:phage terminase large subunit-like protein
VVVTRGKTEENTDLNDEAVASMRAEYGASRLGRQELDAELLERSGKELWTEVAIGRNRVQGVPVTLSRVVVGVDPTRAEHPGDECGIVVAGIGVDGHCYVLEDATVQGSPAVWATAALNAFRANRADKIVYERNRLGRETEGTLRALDPAARWEGVQATDDKPTRAEPVSALYELGKVHHVGRFPVLEDEMVTWDPTQPGPSPNRVDALVWCVTDLMLGAYRAPLVLR